MGPPVALQFETLAAALLRATGDAEWQRRLGGLAMGLAGGPRLHVAIMHEPFLSLLLTGTKTIESRFSRNRVQPYEAVAPGDILALKQQSGPVVGLATAMHVEFYELTPAIRLHLRRWFSEPICATDEAFWEARANARYATLIGVGAPIAVQAIEVSKRDRRGWVALERAEPARKAA